MHGNGINRQNKICQVADSDIFKIVYSNIVFLIIQKGRTPLHYAAKWRRPTYTILVDNGADLNVKDKVRTFFWVKGI